VAMDIKSYAKSKGETESIVSAVITIVRRRGNVSIIVSSEIGTITPIFGVKRSPSTYT
jgi:hypothetical protein